jgi:polysaccharide pyruvyl transferase WcaK-like protein
MLLNNMDFNVCSRFHAHIFSTILRKPFISLSCSRKCREYMKENNLEDNLYQLGVNDIDIPINLNVDQITKFIKNKIDNKEKNIQQLELIMKEIDIKMDKFIDYWSHFVNQNK